MHTPSTIATKNCYGSLLEVGPSAQCLFSAVLPCHASLGAQVVPLYKQREGLLLAAGCWLQYCFAIVHSLMASLYICKSHGYMSNKWCTDYFLYFIRTLFEGISSYEPANCHKYWGFRKWMKVSEVKLLFSSSLFFLPLNIAINIYIYSGLYVDLHFYSASPVTTQGTL